MAVQAWLDGQIAAMKELCACSPTGAVEEGTAAADPTIISLTVAVLFSCVHTASHIYARMAAI